MYNLPKWPQMRVVGDKVTQEQAKEIIFRTDRFLTESSKYAGGNNHNFNELYRKRSGLASLDEQDWEADSVIREKLGVISTSYVDNSWASCAFIYGAHGWCDPQGRIFYQDNVGKWPSAEELIADWKAIAEAFPFLNLHAMFMSGEECEETEFVFGIRVQNGTVEVYDKEDPEVTRKWSQMQADRGARVFMGGENGLPTGWVFDEFAPKVKAAVVEYLAVDPATV